MKITMAHGGGGKATSQLIDSVFAKAFHNPVLARMEDSAVVQGSARLAVTTDSFVINPLFFPGGDIGRLCICGTVNDLLMSGAVPQYLTCGFILEEGAEIEELERIAESMAKTVKEAGVTVIAGDTKVIEGQGGIYINTAGVGFVPEGMNLSAANCAAGDAILVSGNLGDHHAAVLSARMGIENTIVSDLAPLEEMVRGLLNGGIHVKAMRDITRGGLATILHEFAVASGQRIEIEEKKLPVSEQVRGFCGILGLDPLYMGNEGKMAVVVPAEEADRAIEILRAARYGSCAQQIGIVCEEQDASVLMRTNIGGTRVISELYGEGLPRIC